MRPIPQIPRHDRLVCAGIDLPLVLDLTDVRPQVQELLHVPLVEQAAGLRRQALGLQPQDFSANIADTPSDLNISILPDIPLG
jgi:hypothetical protein